MRILVVEDNEMVAKQLVEALQEANFAVDHADNAEDGLEMGLMHSYAAVLLDMNLQSGMDGLDVLRHWREAKRSMPVLFLTVKDRWTDKVTALEAGAHDYIVKPFHIEEVLARLWTHIRIAEGQNATDLVCGPLRLDTGSMRHILLDDSRLQLTGMEFRLLTFMMLHQGKVMSRAALMDHIYDLKADRDSNTLEVFVYKIRKKLGEHRGLLRTVAGRGYYLGEAGDED